MRLLRPCAAAIAAVIFLALPASAKLLIEIDKSAQRMTVSQDGARLYVWPVSTGLRGYDTPGGQFTPFRLEQDHFSREWDDAPMPHSIFFTRQGHAIHGSYNTTALAGGSGDDIIVNDAQPNAESVNGGSGHDTCTPRGVPTRSCETKN